MPDPDQFCSLLQSGAPKSDSFQYFRLPFQSIRLGFESRKAEVQVLKLLGATDAFVRRPFLYSGLWTGLAGGVLACCFVAVFFLWLATPVNELTRLYHSNFQLAGLNALAALTLLGGSALLGITGAWLAINRHLKAMEP